jgi:hypothetical protein
MVIEPFIKKRVLENILNNYCQITDVRKTEKKN